MSPSSLGSIGAYGPAGRLGPVVDRRTVAKTGYGKAVIALRLRTLQPVPAAEAGPVSYVYQTGQDGRRYAVGRAAPLRARALSGVRPRRPILALE